MSIVQTFTGASVDLKDPNPDEITCADIAHHLSHVCRFGGATSRFYSVAEHSVRAAELGAVFGKEAQFAILLHDAHEAYIGDLTTPFASAFPSAFKVALTHMKNRLDTAIGESFGIDLFRHRTEIKLADLAMLDIERRELIPSEVGAYPPAIGAIEELHSARGSLGWSPGTAYSEFMSAFERLDPCEF